LLNTVPRQAVKVSLENDQVDLDTVKDDLGVCLSQTAKELLPIIAKQNRDDGEVLVEALFEAKAIPWTTLEEVTSFLNRHAVGLACNVLLLPFVYLI
jgi:hypothetical protein